ncbi:putative acetyltransferase [compost metagenome]
MIGLCFQTFLSGDTSQIQFLGVLPEYRGRGLATHMIRLALADADANGKERVRLEVTGDDPVAQQLYKKLGFEVTDGEVFYQRPLGEPVRQ